MNVLASIFLLGILGYHLCFLLLAWQLRKRREWIRKILLVLVYLGILGFWGTILQLILDGPIQGPLLYKIYYYTVRIILVLIDASLASSLTGVRDACRGKRPDIPASDISQNAL